MGWVGAVTPVECVKCEGFVHVVIVMLAATRCYRHCIGSSKIGGLAAHHAKRLSTKLNAIQQVVNIDVVVVVVAIPSFSKQLFQIIVRVDQFVEFSICG